MSVMLAQVSGQDHLVRNDAIRRRNAENAYDRQEDYNGTMKKKLSELENLIRGNAEVEVASPKELVAHQAVQATPQEVVPEKAVAQQLDAGQMKRISLPLGKTLEETIRLWRDVRTDAISVPQPTTADHQLASKASAEIRKTEAQIGLNLRANAQVDMATRQANIDVAEVSSKEFSSSAERELHKMQKKYEQAISSYSFHVQMKQSGFEMETPSFYKVA